MPATKLARILLLVAALAACPAWPAQAAPEAAAARYYPQTGFKVANFAFLDFFDRRGGVRTFGYPISREFTFLGSRVQFFQRGVLQLRADGSVGTMNILDSGLMPYTQVNQAVFPAADATLTRAAPAPGSPNYSSAVLSYVRSTAPDSWQSLGVNFFRAFSNTVTAADAYPSGKGNASLLPGYNLELWGIPTSRPSFDPANHDFVYQRFQRGILHHDAKAGTTQGLLLADYLKAILTGQNLPADLATQAATSTLLRQYDPTQPQWVARPKDLSGSDLTFAFEREPIVAIDPGHGGSETGAAYAFSDGVTLREKELALRIASRTAELLRAKGIQVVQLRTSDAGVNQSNKDVTLDKKVNLSDELQARIDKANEANATLWLSIHFNGLPDRSARGTEVYYCKARPYAAQSKRLAGLVSQSIASELKGVGYTTLNRGVKDDEASVGPGNHLYVLGPEAKRPARMPGVLAEALFLTNPQDATALRDPKTIEALARAYANAVVAYYAN